VAARFTVHHHAHDSKESTPQNSFAAVSYVSHAVTINKMQSIKMQVVYSAISQVHMQELAMYDIYWHEIDSEQVP